MDSAAGGTVEATQSVDPGQLDLASLKSLNVAGLTAIAKQLDLPGATGMRKQDLIFQILRARSERSGLMFSEGVLETLPDGYGFLRGPEVMAQPNRPPVLLDQKVTPTAGSKATRFGFSVNYRDEDHDPAAVALVYVDGIPHRMKLAGGKSHSGLYVYNARTYDSRAHDYYFYFEDGRGGTCRVPERGVFSGPVVSGLGQIW